MAGNAGEWALFVDWCVATGWSALPASPDTVLQYLNEEQPAGGTAGRWIAAIRAAHVQAGEPDPCAGPVTRWARRARTGLPTGPEAVAAELAGPCRQVPTTGWPTGVFGRRDRLAFLLHHLAAIPARQLVTLQTDNLSITGRGTIEVKAGGTAGWVAETPGDDAVVCVGCAVLRWWWVLHQMGWGRFREMATSLSEATPRSDHVCANADRLAGKLQVSAGWPLFPAVDRWGNVASDPVPPMSVTGMETVLRDVARQRWTHATVRVPAPIPEHSQQPAPAPIPSAPKLRLSTRRDGATARAHTQTELADVDDRLGDFLAGVDDLNDRINQLLADHTDPA